MKPFEIFIAYISWGTGGKHRPILILMIADDIVSAYPITTQYKNKSALIRTHYFKIAEWKKSGLEKQSYIDTGTLLQLPSAVLIGKEPIGKLTIIDKKRLLDFLQN